MPAGAGPPPLFRPDARLALRLVRALDLALAVLAAAGLLFALQRSGMPLSLLPLAVWLVLPALTATALLWLPALQPPPGDGQRCALQRRSAAILVAGLAPFPGWWSRFPGEPFLAAGAALAVLSWGLAGHRLADYVRAAAVLRACPALARGAVAVRESFFYAYGLPVLSVYGLFLWTSHAWHNGPGPWFDAAALHDAWALLPPPLYLFLAAPFAGLALLLWCATGRLVAGPRGCVPCSPVPPPAASP